MVKVWLREPQPPGEWGLRHWVNAPYSKPFHAVFGFVEGSFDFQDQVAAVACFLMWVLCCREPCQGFKP